MAIGSVAGEFSGFNPVLLLSDLQLAIDDSAESPALEFSEARLLSIWADQSGGSGGCSTSL